MKQRGLDYYLIPKKTKAPALIEPYLYKVDGKDVLITSLILPIVFGIGLILMIIGALIESYSIINLN